MRKFSGHKGINIFGHRIETVAHLIIESFSILMYVDIFFYLGSSHCYIQSPETSKK